MAGSRVVTFIGGPADMQRHVLPDDRRPCWDVLEAPAVDYSWPPPREGEAVMARRFRYMLVPVRSAASPNPTWVGVPA